MASLLSDKEKRKILIKAYTDNNLGDDLFIHTILDRYREMKIEPYLLVYSINKYEYLLKEYPYLVLVEYPVPQTWQRILAKAEEALLGKTSLKEYIYRLCYKELFQKQFDIFINVGGSQFAEYENERFVLTFFLEQIIAENIKADKKFLLNINFGPYQTEKYKKTCMDIFEKYSDVCFRDKDSYYKFQCLPMVRYAPDIVLSNQKLKDRAGHISYKKNRVGINVINLEANIRTLKERKNYIEKYNLVIRELISNLLERQIEVYIIGFSPDFSEREYIHSLLAEYADQPNYGLLHKSVYDGENLETFIQCFTECSFILSTRFHAFILSLLLKKRQWPICYDQKILHVIHDLDYLEPYSKLSDDYHPQTILQYIFSDKHVAGNYEIYEKKSSESFKILDKCLAEAKTIYGVHEI